MVYRVSISSRMQPAADSSPVTLSLSGQLELRSRVAPPASRLLASLTDLSVQAGGEGGTTTPPDLMRDLQLPWGFDLEGGRLNQLRVAGGASVFARSILTTLAAAFQSPTEAGQGDPVVAHEVDGTGRYDASYTRGSEPGAYRKSKLSYQPIAINSMAVGTGSMNLVPKVVESKGELRIVQGRLASSKYTDELLVEIGAASSMRSQTVLELTLIEQGPASALPDWDGLLASTVAVTPGQTQMKEAAKPNPAFDAQRIGGRSFEQALAELESNKPRTGVDAGATPSKAGADAFAAMATILRTQPKALPKAVAAFAKNPTSRLALLDALAAAGTPGALAALAQLAEDRKRPEAVRGRAAYALVRTSQPSAASVDRLIPWLDDDLLKTYALAGLGTFSRRLREQGSTEPSTRAAEALVRLLQVPAWRAWRVEVLRGIANSGYGNALPRVRPLLADTEDSIRAAAIDAIRLMPNADVEELVAAHVGADEKMIVRMTALDAASLRTPNRVLADAVGKTAASAPDLHSRVRAIRLAQRWLPQYPDLRTILEKIARDDSQEQVRKAALAALKKTG
jgi:HEAT repeat protein